MADDVERKFEKLLEILGRFESVIVAFSGGVDSAFLLSAAHQKLGSKVIAVTAESVIYPVSETERARNFAKNLGVEHIVIRSNETEIPEFVENGPERCYYCKKAMIDKLKGIAGSRGVPWVVHGANADDPEDFRPGLRAAEEAGIRAPLLEAGLTKEDIREISRAKKLPTWNLPTMACLASRIPYGTMITAQKLTAVRDAEQCLERLGFRQSRVRHHGTTARIELPTESFGKIIDPVRRTAVVEAFRSIGFYHVALDLEGYVSGKMNRELLPKFKEDPPR
ncbi:MAG TPA: ATP-dependent sacrificial sulfur transferase LarE [Desulfobacteraceae bacterium]|nr:ATP-dependent sacrificial sulfur transferase LarE [Desulfobacteraceae bacterium]